MSSIKKDNEDFVTSEKLEAEIQRCLASIREKCELRHGRDESDLTALANRLSDARNILEASNRNLKDAVETLRETTDNKLENLDKAFRGNGKVGVYEEIRRHTFEIRALFIMVVVIMGFKFYGLGMKDWVDDIMGKKNTPVVVQPTPTITPTMTPSPTPTPLPTVSPTPFTLFSIPGP